MMGAGAIAGVVAGVCVASAGLFMLRWRRTQRLEEGEEGDPTRQGVLAAMLGSLSLPSRYLIGFCLVILGYHGVAYSLPGGLLWLKVPADRLWLMAIVMAVGVGGSLAMDALDRR